MASCWKVSWKDDPLPLSVPLRLAELLDEPPAGAEEPEPLLGEELLDLALGLGGIELRQALLHRGEEGGAPLAAVFDHAAADEDEALARPRGHRPAAARVRGQGQVGDLGKAGGGEEGHMGLPVGEDPAVIGLTDGRPRV